MRISDWSSDVCSSDLYFLRPDVWLEPVIVAVRVAAVLVSSACVAFLHVRAGRVRVHAVDGVSFLSAGEPAPSDDSDSVLCLSVGGEGKALVRGRAQGRAQSCWIAMV